jgi:putative hydrolase of the HAD superfamily
MTTIRAIIFDFFGVIANDQYDEWLARHSFERTHEFAKISRQADLGHLGMPRFFDRLGALTHIPAETVQQEFVHSITINPAVVEVVRDLRQRGYRIGLLSNSNSEWLRGLLAKHRLEPLFEHIIISAEVGYVKPQPQIFQLTLKRFDLAPEAVVFVDDRRLNTAAAQSVGITGVTYIHTEDLRQRLAFLPQTVGR